MEGSEWESIRKLHIKRIAVSIMVGIPVLILCGIFFYNNRDIFSNVEDSTIKKSESLEHSSIKDSVSLSAEDDANEDDTNALESESDSDEVFGIQPEKIKIDKELEKPPLQSSIFLSGIECRTFDREDVRLLLSLKLYYKDSKLYKNVSLIHNDLKVVIQRLVSEMELSSIKKESLKTKILLSVNKASGVELFNDLEYLDFKIEKAVVP